MAVVYDVATAEVLAQRCADGAEVAFSRDGSLVALADEGRSVVIWDWRGEGRRSCYNLRMLTDRDFDQQTETSDYVAAADDTRLIITDRLTGRTICRTGAPLVFYYADTLPNNVVPCARVTAVALSRDGTRLAYAQYWRGIRIWDLRQRPPQQCDGLEAPAHVGLATEASYGGTMPNELAFSGDGRYIAASDTDEKKSTLWDTVTEELLLAEPGYIQARVLADGPNIFPYRARLGQRETTIEHGRAHDVVGWLPECTPSRANLSGKPAWEFNRRTEQGDRVCQYFALSTHGSS
jgi:WD40 repeat protein